MDLEKSRKRSFFGVAMAIILAGAIIFSIGLVAWILNSYSNSLIITNPTIKAMGGLMIIGIGYIILILEEIRKK